MGVVSEEEDTAVSLDLLSFVIIIFLLFLLELDIKDSNMSKFNEIVCSNSYA